MRAWQRPNGYWYGITNDGRRVALRTKDRDEALRQIADLKRRPQGHSVSDIVQSYLREMSERPSHGRMVYAWARLEPYFGHLRPDQITADVCKLYIKRRKKAGIKNGTIAKELTTLRSAVNKLGKNHGAVFAFPESTQPKDRFLTRAEYKRLMAAAKAHHVRLFIMLALTTAGRKEAILDLTWDRVSFETGRINLGRGSRQKGRAVVTMGDELHRHLKRAHAGRTCDYVIEWAGNRVGNIRKGFDQACARAGLDDVTPHVLRHTAAVWMAEEGQSMDVIAQFLGHSDSRTTSRIYARYSPEYLKKAAGILDSALSDI